MGWVNSRTILRTEMIFDNSATRLCLEFYKISIPQTSVLLTDSCWVDGVERQRRGQFVVQYLWKPLAISNVLDPQRHQLDTSCMEVKGWWKCLGLIWWQLQQHCTPLPHSKDPPSHILHWQATSLPTIIWNYMSTMQFNSWRFCPTSGEHSTK